jgi:hypothetical protein
MKSKMFTFSALMFLCFGTVSCSPDKANAPAPHRLPLAPALASENKTVSLKDSTAAEVTLWSLTDRLVFPDPGDFSVLKVDTSCNGGTYRQKVALPLKKEIPLFQLLPRQVLLEESSPEKPLDCDFQFVALNEAGDTHRFNLPRLKLMQAAQADLSVESVQGAVPAPFEFLDVREAQNWLSRSALGASFETRLLCSSGEVNSFHPTDTRTLSDFDFESLKTKELLQTCRVIQIDQNGVLEAFSQKINLRLRDPDLRILPHPKSALSLRFSGGAAGTDAFSDLPYSRNSNGLPVIEFEIQNGEDTPLIVGLPFALEHQSFASLQKSRDLNSYAPTLSGHCREISGTLLLAANLAPLQKTHTQWLFEIPPKGALMIDYNLKASTNSRVQSQGLLVGLPFLSRVPGDIRADLYQSTAAGLQKYSSLDVGNPHEVIQSEFSAQLTQSFLPECFRP